ncbi:hypothetical protein JOE09_000041 [Pantoea coffeiphila]|nr:hypothetical protein [Pantoea coffeiphila]
MSSISIRHVRLNRSINAFCVGLPLFCPAPADPLRRDIQADFDGQSLAVKIIKDVERPIAVENGDMLLQDVVSIEKKEY